VLQQGQGAGKSSQLIVVERGLNYGGRLLYRSVAACSSFVGRCQNSRAGRGERIGRPRGEKPRPAGERSARERFGQLFLARMSKVALILAMATVMSVVATVLPFRMRRIQAYMPP